MSERWRRFVAFISEREDARALSLIRISMGLLAAGEMLEMILSQMVELVWVGKAFGGTFSLTGSWLVQALGGPSPTVVWALVWCSMLGGVAVALGLGGRLAPFVTLQAYEAVTSLNSQARGGYDSLLTNALWLLVLGGASATWSLDAHLARKSFRAPAETLAIARRLFVFQLLIVYGTTGLQKMSPVWTPVGGFSALYWVFQEPTWGRYDMRFTAQIFPLMQIATAVTWLWELGAWLMFPYLWLRHTRERGGRLRRWLTRFDLRLPFLATGVMLHLGILLLLSVGPFSLVSVAFYPAFFTWSELERGWRWLRARRSKDARGDQTPINR